MIEFEFLEENASMLVGHKKFQNAKKLKNNVISLVL